MKTNAFYSEIKNQVWFKPFTILAIFLFILTHGLMWNEDGIAQEKLLDIFSQIPVWLIFLLVAGVAPLLEESVFRYGIRFRKVGFYVYLLLMLALAGFSSGSITISVILVLLSGFIAYRKEKKQCYLNFLILFSSLAFALAHISNSGNITLYVKICYLSNLFSIGLILMLIRLRWGLIFSILAHSVWNFSAVMMMFTLPPKTIDCQTENLNIHLEKNAIFKNSNGSYFNVFKDTLKVKNVRPSKIVKHYFDRHYLKIFIESFEFVNYSGYVVEDSLSLSELSQQLGFDLDTITVNTIHYVISDSLQEGFQPINYIAGSTPKQHYSGAFRGQQVKDLIKEIAWQDMVRVHINFTDSILDTKIDMFEYSKVSDFTGKMELLSQQLNRNWYFRTYQEKEEGYVLKDLY